MTTLMLKMLMLSFLMALLYQVLLAKQKTFLFNRLYLLAACLLPLVLPFVSIPVHIQNKEVSVASEYLITVASTQEYITEQAVNPALSALSTNATQDFTLWFWVGYGIISIYLLIRFMYRLYVLFALRSGGIMTSYAGIPMVLVQAPIQTFSFWQTIFVPQKDFLDKAIAEEVLQHEAAHCRQMHSIDVLLAELLLVFTWWNPVNWILKSAIRLNHEFLADQAVVGDKADTKLNYLQLLLQTVVTQNRFQFGSDFNKTCLKKRFIMIQKTSSSKSVIYCKNGLLILAVAFISLCSFSYDTVIPTMLQSLTGDTVPKITIPLQRYQPNGFDSAFISKSFSSTKEGVSHEEMDTYYRITDKYNEARLQNKQKRLEVSDVDKKTLKDIYGRMSPEQQMKVPVKFIKRWPPFGKQVPSEALFAKFKNSAVYGVWIDDKKVSNEVLTKYKAADFAHYSVSKLYGGAKKGRNYTHQLNLMTNEGYAKYLEEYKALANEPVMLFSWRAAVVKVN